MTKLQWCRDNAPDTMKNLGDKELIALLGGIYERLHGKPIIDVSNYKQLDAISTSKGNQRKWYDETNKRYIKEQFFYQGRYWDDYKVEALSYKLSQQLDTLGVVVTQQSIVQLGSTYGVSSDDFTVHGDFVSMQRLLQATNTPWYVNEFPMVKFNKVLKFVEDTCKIDITNYLLVMCVMDCILLNEDRHLNNFGVLHGEDGYSVAPLFDFGLGLFQHDLRYIGMSLDTAYAYVEGKPFYEDLTAFVQTLIRSGYKDKIAKILNHISEFDVSIITDVKAQQHVDRTIATLNKLCGE